MLEDSASVPSDAFGRGPYLAVRGVVKWAYALVMTISYIVHMFYTTGIFGARRSILLG